MAEVVQKQSSCADKPRNMKEDTTQNPTVSEKKNSKKFKLGFTFKEVTYLAPDRSKNIFSFR